MVSCQVRQPGVGELRRLDNRVLESCPISQPDARRAARLGNRGLESCSGWTTRRIESCPVRQLGTSLANNTIIMIITTFLHEVAESFIFFCTGSSCPVAQQGNSCTTVRNIYTTVGTLMSSQKPWICSYELDCLGFCHRQHTQIATLLAAY